MATFPLSNEIDTDICPEHGEQVVIGGGVTGPIHDPYTASRLACGHYVACFGPRDPNVIVRNVRRDIS